MRLKKNKKAQVYPLFVALFTIIALTYAFIHLQQTKKVTDLAGNEVVIGEKQIAVFSSLQDSDAVNIFVDQAAEISAQEAIAKIRQSCFFYFSTEQEVLDFFSPCGKYIFPLWSTKDTLCLPDCETAFINAFEYDFISRIDNYYKLTGVELPRSYKITLDNKKDYANTDYFLVHGLSDSSSGVKVLSMEARLVNPMAVAMTYSGEKMLWPVDYPQKILTSCFGHREIGYGSKDHPAVDIFAPKGTPVLAAADGKVDVAAHTNCDSRVVINHGSGISTEYLHLDTVEVKVDDKVVKGQRIGTVGRIGEKMDDVEKKWVCGEVFEPHLHFALIYKGVPESLKYGDQKLALESYGENNRIQPECLLESPGSKSGSNCNTPVNTEIDKVCPLYNLPAFFEKKPVGEYSYFTERKTQPGINVNYAYFGQVLSKPRPEGQTISKIVLHHTAGASAKGAVLTWIQNSGDTSAHYVVDKDGTIYYVIDESRNANHAGCKTDASQCQAGGRCALCRNPVPATNANSIGIEIVNTGKADDSYTDKQYAAIKDLINDIGKRQGITINNDNVVAHYEVTSDKIDPSPVFDWSKVGLDSHKTLAQVSGGCYGMQSLGYNTDCTVASGASSAGGAANSITGGEVLRNSVEEKQIAQAQQQAEAEKIISAGTFGTYSFKPGFTTRVNKKIVDPIQPITEWFKDTWDTCTGEEKSPGECLNNKITEFNDKKGDYRISFGDQCGKYPIYYNILEFIEDCLTDGKFKCSCEFDPANAYSSQDLQIWFNVEDNSATLLVKENDGKFVEKAKYVFSEPHKLISSSASYTHYIYRLHFDEKGKFLSGKMTLLKPSGDLDDVMDFVNDKALRIVKPEKPEEGFFVDNPDQPSCQYKKDKFRLCAKPIQEKPELFALNFSIQLKDKPPEPVKEGEVKLIETDTDKKSLLDKIPGVANLLANFIPPLGFLLTAAEIYDAVNSFTDQPQNLQVIVDVPKGKDGKPLDVAGYEVYCNDFLTQVLPKDVLDTYNPSHFVVMANQELNQKVSQLDNYVKTNSYSDFIDMKDCDVPVSKSNGETVLVPGLNGVYKDGKMVFNLNKCGDLSMIIGKFLGKNYCVSLVPIDENGNKMTDQAISNCVKTNSVMDLVIDEMIKKELGAYIPSDLIPKDLQSYIKMPDTSDLVDAALGNRDFSLVSLVDTGALNADIKEYVGDFVVNTINNDIVGSSVVNSINDLNFWDKQRVLTTLSGQIKDEDAKLLFDSFVSGSSIEEGTRRAAMAKGVDYLDKSKAPGILKEIIKGEDPESAAYNEVVKAAQDSLSSDQKKQDLLDVAQSSSGSELKENLIQKAVEKGCVDNYGVSVETAISCLRDDEIEEIYNEAISNYQNPEQARQALMDKAIDKMEEKAPDILKNVAQQRDFQGLAYQMLQNELDKLPDDDKKRFINDALEGRMIDAETIQSEVVKMIPALNNQYVNALLQDGDIKGILESALKSALEKQVGSFFQGECVKVHTGNI